jgi:hypothetical protein
VAVNDRLGNYLFRVEVHDVDPAAKTVTLKWSRDNGAEACASATPPPGFDQGDWVWEYFDADTERLLGLHLGGTTPKLRGLIREAWNVPTGANEPQAFARQWDGYGIFRTDTGALVKGRDRGVTLATAAADDPAHGSCWVAGNDLLVNLENLALRLSVKGRQFVPGDHWLATIREAVQASGDVVLNQAPPHGVRHHFLRLGTLLDDGSLQPPTDAERRRLAFPPLSDLHAADVGFTEQCNPCSTAPRTCSRPWTPCAIWARRTCTTRRRPARWSPACAACWAWPTAPAPWTWCWTPCCAACAPTMCRWTRATPRCAATSRPTRW